MSSIFSKRSKDSDTHFLYVPFSISYCGKDVEGTLFTEEERFITCNSCNNTLRIIKDICDKGEI